MKTILILINYLLFSWSLYAQETKLNKLLITKLDSIYTDDQKYRLQIDGIDKKYGWDSHEMKELWRVINRKDSLNFIKVEAILNNYGWLGVDVVGEVGNTALFLVIQHSNISTRKEYLPMMRVAVKNGKAKGSELALLEDRVALGEGKKQIYESQIGRDIETNLYYVLPLEDPDHVDQRRAEVGLQPMADYASNYGVKWDINQYKKDLPKIEAKAKVKHN